MYSLGKRAMKMASTLERINKLLSLTYPCDSPEIITTHPKRFADLDLVGFIKREVEEVLLKDSKLLPAVFTTNLGE